jgi:alpha-amylase
MGDEKVPLPDVDTSNPTVIERYGEWIQNFVKEYKIDGLRIDGKRIAAGSAYNVFDQGPSRSSCQVSSPHGLETPQAYPFQRHVQKSFWPDFCGKAGVFCMGEVFGGAEVE